MLLKFIVILYFSIFIQNAFAEPTKEQAVEFIESKARSCGEYLIDTCDTQCMRNEGVISQNEYEAGHSHLEKIFYEIKINIKNNLLSVIEKTSERNSGVNADGNFLYHFNRTYTSSASLNDLSPKVTLSKAGNRHKINIKCHSTDCFTVEDKLTLTKLSVTGKDVNTEPAILGDSSGSLDKQIYIFCSSETAEKVAKAFSHLITLHGGKKELF